MPEAQQQEVDRKQVRDIILHFKAIPQVSNDALLEYCTRMGYTPISSGTYEDWLYQYNSDMRIMGVIPQLMATLGRFQNVPMLGDDGERKLVADTDIGIIMDMLVILENGGIEHDEVDRFMRSLASQVGALIESVGTRASNLIKDMLKDVAEEKYGRPVTLKQLGERYREKNPQ